MPTSPDLLIVGAGPVGLTLACEACRHGLSVRIIDKRESASIHSKAQLVHTRTLELLDDMGIVDRFIDRGVDIHSVNLFRQGSSKRFASITIGGVDSRYQGMLSIPQYDTEQLLIEHLATFGVHVERRVRLESFVQTGDAVTATLVHEDKEGDDQQQTLLVPWLAGCDGAHSTVRHGLNLSFEGHQYPLHLFQTDARVDFPFDVHGDEVIAYPGVGAIAGFFPLPHGEHRYRLLIPFLGEQEQEPQLKDFQDVLDRICPEGTKVSDPAWMVAFRIHCRQASSFHVGRIFLAGDAGHIHSPAGGQGMNMGMQDAYNLAWKLALHHKGKAKKDLLDSYHVERHQVGAATLKWTDRMTQPAPKMLGLRSPLVMEARNQLAGFITSFGLVQQRISTAFSMIDVAYDESPVCGEARAALLAANVTLDKTSETPTVHAWRTFHQAPHPGQRAPDAYIDPHREDSTRLHDLFRGTAHTLLLFDGAAATAEGYENLATIARGITARFGPLIRPHIIVPGDQRPEALGEDLPVLLDPHSELHSKYGAATECLYLVRPDGYIGFRSQPADAEALTTYLKRIFFEA